MRVHERPHSVEPFALTVRQVEVHWAFLAFLLKIVGGTVCPPSVVRKTSSAAETGGGGDGRLAGDAPAPAAH
jgi:hypothetical protein